MAESIAPVTIPEKTWTNLYTVTGIALGTQLSIQNVGRDHARYSESVLIPTNKSGSNSIYKDKFITTITSPVGAWAYSRLGTVLQVDQT